MTRPSPTDSLPAAGPAIGVASIGPLFLALILLMLGNGLQGSLVGIRAELEAFDTAIIGLVMSAYYVGFLAGTSVTPRFVGQVGHVRVYAGLASMASTVAIVQAVVVNPGMWWVTRLLSGFCMAGLYVVAESWLNGASTNANRGRILAIYMVVVTGGIGAGQLLLNLADPRGFELFVVASVLVSLAVVPISLVRSDAPAYERPAGLPFRHIWEKAPIGVAGTFFVGMANGTVLALGPVWATAQGLSVPRVSVIMGLVLIGGVALQGPLGWASDHFSRRRVMFVVTTAAAGAALALGGVRVDSGWLLPLAFLFGGLTMPLYSLAISHVGDMVPQNRMVAVSAALLFINGVGSILGPITASLAMAAVGPQALWMSIAAVHGVFGLYAVYGLVVRRSIEVLQKHRYRPLPPRSAMVTAGTVWDDDGADFPED